MIYSDDELDTGENENQESYTISGRDSVVFAIDCCKEMFESCNDEESPFSCVITAIHDMYLNKIITSDKDLHGIIFFGTEKSKNSSDLSNIYVWQNFDVPCVESIMQLRQSQETDWNTFNTEYGSKPDHQISDVLWACLNMFSGTTYKLSSKTLLLFTWNDDPHFGNNNARKRAKAKAGDLHEHDIDVQVLSFNSNFKHEKFYKDIVSDPTTIGDMANPLNSIMNLYSYLMRKCSKQRALTRIPFRLAKGVEMSVGVYTIARRATKASAVLLDSETNKQAHLHTNYVDTNTAEILMPSDIKLLQTWAGQDIVFEKEEVENIKKIEKLGLTVLGFKSRNKAIKLWYHVRTAQFIYPDDSTVKGSNTLFTALLTKCLEKDVVAICCYVPRANSAPKMVALLPQKEEIDDKTSEQIKPPGFYVIFLPYADDIRKVDINKTNTRATDEQVAAAEAMIKRLRFTYDPDNFDNPALQTHYKNLEAMALEKDEPDPIEDHTIPDFERITRKAGAQIQAFKDLVFSPGYDPTQKPLTKRKAGGTGDAVVKKVKPETSQINVQECVTDNKLGKLTVQVLKEICKEHNIQASGKKADIIAAISDHFQGL
uniref:DNA helicase n=1 Tax=Phallusia mammillata TaxID=59560 RepID=A0A6F9DXW2_9ASCI|nr:X-ray repair cross-complementing protein 5 [Phallusia mammillata]